MVTRSMAASESSRAGLAFHRRPRSRSETPTTGCHHLLAHHAAHGASSSGVLPNVSECQSCIISQSARCLGRTRRPSLFPLVRTAVRCPVSSICSLLCTCCIRTSARIPVPHQVLLGDIWLLMLYWTVSPPSLVLAIQTSTYDGNSPHLPSILHL
ncbi:hypothetical protein K474DRAFT_1665899, partial [Panus rudis PR-1116 ss-1]